MDYVAVARKYARDVLSGKVLACEFVRLSCQRQIDDLARWKGKGGDYYFDTAAANRVCAFVELIPHIKGEWANRGETIKLEPWQVFILTTVFGWIGRDGSRRFRTVYIEVPRKNAKAEWIENLIPTPDGFKRMGDLQPGDMVFGSGGEPIRIRAVTDEMLGHECMTVEFSAGESITVAADHLWEVNQRIFADNRRARWTKAEDDLLISVYPSGGANALEAALPHRSRCASQRRADFLGIRKKDGGRNRSCRRLLTPRIFSMPEISSVIDTRKISETLTYGARGDNRYSVNVAPPVCLPTAILPVPPYTLGAWLGDGTSAAAHITVGYADLQILDNIRSEGVSADERKTSSAGCGGFALGQESGRGWLISSLRALGVAGDKHIPTIYLRASGAQRLALLQGLMDTDGTVSRAGQCSFTNTNRRLAYDTQELLASLGVKATLREKRAKLYGKDCGAAFDVAFFPPHGMIVFGLTRKQSRVRDRARSRSDTRSITAVRPSRSLPVKCIEVEAADGIYLTGRGFIPTHNSTISSAVALYMLLMDGESGANVYSAATTKDQARIVFDAAQEMARRTPELREATGAQVLAHAIICERTGSKLQPLSAERDSLDGLNMHCGMIDELHAHKSRAVFDVLETATGSRRQPLVWVITTAGSNRTGVCYEQRTYVTRLLQKVLRDETYFGIVYTIDDGDDWTNPAIWAKANPNLGVSIYPDDMARLCAKAVEVASAQNTFLTKRLNVWVSSHSAWMNMIDWAACGAEPVNIEDFAGEECWIGVDLATKIDVAAVSILFKRDKKYYAFGKYYLPEDSVAERARTVSSHYDGWAREGRFTLTPGNVTDFEFIRDDILLMASKFQVKSVAYDPWQATQFAGELMADGAPMVEFRQTVANISEPMKQLEALVKSRRIEHGGCPVLAWMASNVVAHLDAKENIYPRKERPENKIDGIVALIMALGVAMIQTQSNILSSDEIIARMGDVI